MKKIFISALLISSLSSVFAETINLESSQDSLIDSALIVSSLKNKKEDIFIILEKSIKESYYYNFDRKSYFELIKNENNKKRNIFIAYLDNDNNYIHIPKCENCIVITRYFDED